MSSNKSGIFLVFYREELIWKLKKNNAYRSLIMIYLDVVGRKQIIIH